jgi:hypothetical protein
MFDADGKREEAAHAEVGDAAGPPRGIEGQAGHPRDERTERDRRLETRQGMAEAVVDAVTERQMVIVFPAYVEAIGIRRSISSPSSAMRQI